MDDEVVEGNGQSRGQRTLSRRRVLGGLGAVAGTAAGALPFVRLPIAGPSQSSASASEAGKRQWAFVIDMRRCDGCEACTKACQKTHYLPKDHEWIKVFEIKDKQGRKSFMPRLC